MSARMQHVAHSLARVLERHEDELVDAAVSDLSFVRSHARSEVSTVLGALDSMGRLDAIVDGRDPTCREGEWIALLQPYNVVAWPLWDLVSLCGPGNRVRMRLSKRSQRISDVIRSIVGEVFPDMAMIDDLPREEFLAVALEDPCVPVVIAYGSEDLGRLLLDKARQTSKRVIFEGPGKDPMVVLPGADAEIVASLLREAKFNFSGQQCTSTELLIVDEGEYEAIVGAVAAMVAELVVGDPDDPRVDVGPVGSHRVPPLVRTQLIDAQKKGATIIAGGGIQGDRIEPTLVTGVLPDMLIWQNETFAPVLAITSVPNPSVARELVRETRFGLHCIVCGDGAVTFAAGVTGASYAEVVPEPTFGPYGTATVGRRPYSKVDDFASPFGGYGVSGWIWERGELRQGPKLLAREGLAG